MGSNDYYPFGMVIPGRSFSAGSQYRYGFNGQEKSIEIGEGLTTAEFWEFDARIGRRWNIDPKPNQSLSLYSTFGNNPIFYNDPFGDTTHLIIYGSGYENTSTNHGSVEG